MNWRQRVLVGVGLALVTGLIGLVLGRVPFFRDVEWKLYDLRMRQTVDPAQCTQKHRHRRNRREVDPRFRPAGRPLALAARDARARCIDYLARAPARLIVYDVLFLEHDRQQAIDIGGAQMSGAESDQELVDATARPAT